LSLTKRVQKYNLITYKTNISDSFIEENSNKNVTR